MNVFEITEQQPEVGIWVLVWHQITWLKGCRLHDGWRIIYADGQRDYSPEEVQVTHWTLLPPEPGDESPSSDPAEVQQLRQWKKEATALLDPILEYGLKHPDIKLGQSATSFVLNRAKSAEVLVKALETALYYHVLSPDLHALFTTALSQYEQLKQQ